MATTMETYNGLTGGIKINLNGTATDFVFMKGFELEIARDTLEIITLGNRWKDKIIGQASWSGTFDGYLNINNLQQKAIFDILLADETCLATPSTTEVATELSFVLNADNIFLGDAFISDVKISMTSEDIATVSFSFVGNGDLKCTALN